MDIAANRRAQKWNHSELLRRGLWGLATPLFALSPRPFFWFWRVWLLRAFGANIGRHVRICPSAKITIPWNLRIDDWVTIGDRTILYALGQIWIGSKTTVSQGAHLCAGTHRFDDPSMPLEKPPITIEQSVWICADAFVGPGVTIGRCAVIGARAVVTKDVPPMAIMVGNPAQKKGERK